MTITSRQFAYASTDSPLTFKYACKVSLQKLEEAGVSALNFSHLLARAVFLPRGTKYSSGPLSEFDVQVIKRQSFSFGEIGLYEAVNEKGEVLARTTLFGSRNSDAIYADDYSKYFISMLKMLQSSPFRPSLRTIRMTHTHPSSFMIGLGAERFFSPNDRAMALVHKMYLEEAGLSGVNFEMKLLYVNAFSDSKYSRKSFILPGILSWRNSDYFLDWQLSRRLRKGYSVQATIDASTLDPDLIVPGEVLNYPVEDQYFFL